MADTAQEKIAHAFMVSIWDLHFNFFRKSKLPIPIHQFSILMELSIEGEPVTIHDLCDTLKIKKQQMTLIISRLESLGYITRTVKDSDRRYSELKLTPSGQNIVKSFFDNIYKRALAMIESTPEKEQVELLATFSAYAAAIEKLSANE